MTPAELLPALPWLGPFFALPRLARTTPTLSHFAPISGQPVSIIVPARNEAANIEAVISSILASAYQPFELLIVDDRSIDDTSTIVHRLAKGDARLRIVDGDPLPDEWYGKPWACLQGYRAARHDILLFTDADTRHSADLLGCSVAALRQEHADLLTVAPHQRCDGFWERLVMPQVWLLLGLRYQPERVNHARRRREVIANGQFLMTTREAYEAIGTHAAVAREVAEDLALAQRYFGAGRKLYFALARDLMETRMYRNLAEIVEGWSKNVYLGGRRSFPDDPLLRALVPLMLVVAFGFWLVPPVAAVLSGGAGRFGAASIAATALSALFWMLVSAGMRIPFIYGIGYPLGAAIGLFIAARSTWRGSRKVIWRGRNYRD